MIQKTIHVLIGGSQACWAGRRVKFLGPVLYDARVPAVIAETSCFVLGVPGGVQRPWYEKVIPEDKLRILVYSGDADTCVNTLWSQWWTSGLQGLKEIEPWRGWTTDNEVPAT